MRVCIVGAGYVGLVTGVGLAQRGHEVTCVDAVPATVAEINAARSPIFEEGLHALLQANVGDRLTASTDLAGAVPGADLVLVCVGTPSRPDGSMDTTALERAMSAIGAALPAARAAGVTRPCVVVKSTVVPGTTDGLLSDVLARSSGLRPGIDFGVGANPEFLTEGQAVADFMAPDRIVYGGDEFVLAAMRELYASFSGVQVVETNARTAEMIKYASNALLAAAISFTNEIADLGEAIGGIDPVEVMRGVHSSRYLTVPRDADTPVKAGLASFYEAGCGYGGSCLPKDVAALAALGRDVGVPTRVLDAVASVNADRPARLVEMTGQGLDGLHGRRVTVLGLAFKPGTDDTRSSPAFPVVRMLLAAGADVTVHDPIVGPEAVAEHGAAVTHTNDLAAAVAGADAVVIVTRWDDYLAVPDLVARADPAPLVVDGRRMLDPDAVSRYAGIGIGAPSTPATGEHLVEVG